MKHHLRRVEHFLPLAAFWLIFCTNLWPCARCTAQQLSEATREQIDQVAAALIDRAGIPGLSLAVAVDNELVYTRGWGLADLENAVPVTPQTKFRTASIAKPITAAVVMSLVDAGKLDLDADICEYCPDYPAKQWSISPRQLLGHLAGVRHYKNRTESSATDHYFDLRSALATFKDDPLLHEPGSKYLYSSFGYNLLGSVAEGAAQQPFAQMLEELVLQPAGMTMTVVDDHFAVIPHRARGYIRPDSAAVGATGGGQWEPGTLLNASLHDTSMKIPGGGLLSTPADLVRFATALNTGQLLSPTARELSWTSQQTHSGEQTGYGLGWRIAYRSGQKMVSHTGGQAGTSTVLVLFPESGTAVALMCNLQNTKLTDAAIAMASLVMPERATDDSQPLDYAQAVEPLRIAIERELEQKQIPALSISLVDGDQVVWSGGFGFLDAEATRPATAASIYRVGSVSKLFTDLAVMQLAESGQVDIDAPLQHYLPNFQPDNPFDQPITLRQLMSHRSGLVRESPVGSYFDPDEPGLQATVDSLSATRLVYPPETRTKYSNAAIAVVGAVLEQVTGQPQPELLRQAIFEPLRMSVSTFDRPAANSPHLATGWMRTYDGRRFVAPDFQLGTGPAGNLYSSVEDLAKFLSWMFRSDADGASPAASDRSAATGESTATPLRAETLQQMLTPGSDSSGRTQDFGIGFQVRSLDGYRKVGHGGAVYGFSTQLEALPERKLGVAAVASLDCTNGVVTRLTDYALRLMMAVQEGRPLPEYRFTTKVPSERAAELVGSYREQAGESLVHVTELAGEVHLQRGQFRYDVRAAEEDGQLLLDDAMGFGTTVALVDPNTLRVAGKNYQRLADVPPDEPPDRWLGLIGEYGWDHNTLYVLEDHGQLVALIEWFFYYPLEELSEDEFAFPDYGLYHGERLKFVRDSSGRASAVTAAEVRFERRQVGPEDGQTFRIQPLQPIEQLRAAALEAEPPSEAGQFRAAELVELTALDPSIGLDIRYASENNFIGARVYQQARAFLQRPAAEALVRVHQRLEDRGLGLLVFDGYRPWHVTKIFWDATPPELRHFVANPARGSRHNRGCAVDLTLLDRIAGQPIPMVAGYDEFSPRSYPLYPGGTSRQRWYRDLLRRSMEAADFRVYEYEWWHFDFRDWQLYPIGNWPFEELVP